jgi:hypothetical protein
MSNARRREASTLPLQKSDLPILEEEIPGPKISRILLSPRPLRGAMMRRREAGRGAAPAGFVATKHSGGIGAPPGTNTSPCQELADRPAIAATESEARCRKPPRRNMRYRPLAYLSACGAPRGASVSPRGGMSYQTCAFRRASPLMPRTHPASRKGARMSAVAVRQTPSLPSMGRESRFLARRVGCRARRSTSCRSRLTSPTPTRFFDARASLLECFARRTSPQGGGMKSVSAPSRAATAGGRR